MDLDFSRFFFFIELKITCVNGINNSNSLSSNEINKFLAKIIS